VVALRSEKAPLNPANIGIVREVMAFVLAVTPELRVHVLVVTEEPVRSNDPPGSTEIRSTVTVLEARLREALL
jgi:molybdopterin biosynthesis enzyme